MSTQRGSNTRSRPQKYQNKSKFKNDLHDTSHRIKLINSIQVSEVCARCKDIIDWKIKYKKYKPLTQAKTCNKCNEKKVKKAYHTICTDCGSALKVCTKCGLEKEIIPAPPDEREQLRLDNELQQMLKTLPERKRRTFLRYMNKKRKDPAEEHSKEDLVGKLNELSVGGEELEDDDFDITDDDDDDDSSFGKDDIQN